MPDAQRHVSSAVVTTRPEASQSVIDRLGLLVGVEVHAAAAGKIVVVIEGPTAGYLGDRLIQISAMEDVLAAHMVFEQAMDEEDMFDDGGTHAA